MWLAPLASPAVSLVAFLDFFSKSNKSIEELIQDSAFDKALEKIEPELKVAMNREDHGKIPLYLRHMVRCQIELGLEDQAVDTLCRLGEYYTARGFFPKAVSTFKKALKLKPDSAHLMERIADFNNQVPKYFINTQEANKLLEQSELVRDNQMGGEPDPD